jgi:hypothetical protein
MVLPAWLGVLIWAVACMWLIPDRRIERKLACEKLFEILIKGRTDSLPVRPFFAIIAWRTGVLPTVGA